jgi:hypothetical protein
MLRYLAAALACVAASPAEADWQYTRWGMTPKQVVAASRGAAKPNTDGEATRDNYKTLLRAPFVAGEHRFTASFIFNNQNRLIRISLGLTGGNCERLGFDLRSQYGDAVRGLPYRWRDERRKNNVAYMDWGGGNCVVEYWPFDASGDRL